MNAKGFLVDALSGALDLGIATPDDVIRHATPDVLARHLPRPLWARLLTACLGAPKVDAQLVIETIGVPNLCEHLPSPIVWACVAEVAARALGQRPAAIAPSMSSTITTPTPAATPTPVSGKPSSGPVRVPLAPPPPEAPAAPLRPTPNPIAAGPAIPPPATLSEVIDDLDFAEEKPGKQARVPSAQRFRQSSTGIAGRTLGGTTRRPQASAPVATPTPAPTAPAARIPRRVSTELSETETETSVDSEWRGKELAVDDSQLVDWQAESTAAGDDDFGDLRNKR